MKSQRVQYSYIYAVVCYLWVQVASLLKFLVSINRLTDAVNLYYGGYYKLPKLISPTGLVPSVYAFQCLTGNNNNLTINYVTAYQCMHD